MIDRNKLIDELIHEDDNHTIKSFLDIEKDINSIKTTGNIKKDLFRINDRAYSLWEKNIITLYS